MDRKFKNWMSTIWPMSIKPTNHLTPDRWIYTPGATAMRRAMKLLRWRSNTVAESLHFCCAATIVFSSCCLLILITFCLWFQMAITQRRSDIAKVKIISTLLRQRAMILATKIFTSDGQQWCALSLRWDSDVESDIADPSHRCRIERPSQNKTEDSNIWRWKSR
jgi:hypothetical protein